MRLGIWRTESWLDGWSGERKTTFTQLTRQCERALALTGPPAGSNLAPPEIALKMSVVWSLNRSAWIPVCIQAEKAPRKLLWAFLCSGSLACSGFKRS
jgi:hypothetical protein